MQRPVDADLEGHVHGGSLHFNRAGGKELYPDKQSPVNEMSEKTSDGALEPPGESPLSSRS
jgi:hypothetical protein